MPDIELTERELAIAEKAAELAVKKITDGFYADLGRTVVKRWLVIIGVAVAAWFAGKSGLPLK